MVRGSRPHCRRWPVRERTGAAARAFITAGIDGRAAASPPPSSDRDADLAALDAVVVRVPRRAPFREVARQRRAAPAASDESTQWEGRVVGGVPHLAFNPAVQHELRAVERIPAGADTGAERGPGAHAGGPAARAANASDREGDRPAERLRARAARERRTNRRP